METSDSEYFESADEDFQSDEEDTNTVKSDETSDNKCIKSTTTQLKNVKITETEQETDVASSNNNKSSHSSKIDNLRDDDNNVSSCEINRKVKKEPTKKLGSKVNPKVDVEKPEETNIPEEATKKSDTVSAQSSEPVNEKCSTEESYTTQNVTPKPKTDEKIPPVCEKPRISPVESTVEEKSKDEENLWDDSEIDWAKETEEDNMWENDDWEPIEQPESEKPLPEMKPQPKQVPAENNSWSSWGNWGVSSILTTATQSVSTLTQGISTVLESGIGVPEPEELARINQAEKDKLKEVAGDSEEDKGTGFGLGNLVMGVSHLTKLVETTSTKVISGGLDTLETIGKKTMEVLQEGDPGLKKKRAFLKIDQDKPVLSQLLREAKEKAEEENNILEQKHFAKKAKNYETLFDDHQGLVHLEALEMLSRQCDIKLETLLESYTDESLTEMQETMEQVKELCELPDEDEDEQANWSEILEKVNSAVSEIGVPISYKKLIDTWEETETWLNTLKLEVCDERELHQQAVETLAQLTAIAVEQFHKTGELLLVKEHRSTADEADSLVQLTTSLTSLIGIVAAKFSDKLNAKSSSSKNKETINGLITNVFFEAANSSSYIQDAFQLLVPVLQVGAV